MPQESPLYWFGLWILETCEEFGISLEEDPEEVEEEEQAA